VLWWLLVVMLLFGARGRRGLVLRRREREGERRSGESREPRAAARRRGEGERAGGHPKKKNRSASPPPPAKNNDPGKALARAPIRQTGPREAHPPRPGPVFTVGKVAPSGAKGQRGEGEPLPWVFCVASNQEEEKTRLRLRGQGPPGRAARGAVGSAHRQIGARRGANGEARRPRRGARACGGAPPFFEPQSCILLFWRCVFVPARRRLRRGRNRGRRACGVD